MADSQPSSEIKRQTAYKCNIFALNTGTFVKKQGWESSYLMTDYGDFSRVNILGVIVAKDESSATIDDSTGQINGRLFDNITQLSVVNIGDGVLIIGRPREFNNKIYLTIELIKKIDNRWLNYRKKELSLIKKVRDISSNVMRQEKKPSEPVIIDNVSTINSKEKMLKVITELDKGEGANIEDVIKLSKVGNGEELISDMMMRGEIYEPKAGCVKLM